MKNYFRERYILIIILVYQFGVITLFLNIRSFNIDLVFNSIFNTNQLKSVLNSGTGLCSVLTCDNE